MWRTMPLRNLIKIADYYSIKYNLEKIAISIEEVDRYDNTSISQYGDVLERNFGKYGPELWSRDKEENNSNPHFSQMYIVIKDDDGKIVGGIDGKEADINNYMELYVTDKMTVKEYIDYLKKDPVYYLNLPLEWQGWAKFLSYAHQKLAFEVGDLGIDNKYRAYFLPLIKQGISKIKSKGFRYVVFSAMADTQRLFMDGDKIRPIIAKRLGLELVAMSDLNQDFVDMTFKII